MAKKVQTITTFVDDISGDELADGKGETVKFALDGTTYEIDLGDKNAKKLRDALAPYIEAGRKVGRGATRASSGRNSKEELAAARTWLRENGHEVSDKGRVPAKLLALYRESQ